METLQTTLADFQHYVRRPHYSRPLADQPGNKPALAIHRFLAGYPLVVGILFITASTVLLTRFITGQAVFTPLLERYSTSVGLLVVAVFIAVVIEEGVFRAILRLTPNRLRNIIALALWLILSYYYRTIKEAGNEYILSLMIFLWVVIVYGLNRFLKRPAIAARIEQFWQANFRWIFYGIGLFYSFVKIIDDVETLTAAQALVLPILALSTSLNGFYFGYIRMKYGFWYAVVVHILVLMAALAPEAISLL